MAKKRASAEVRNEHLEFVRETIRAEGLALLALADRVHDDVARAAQLIAKRRGNVIVTGMGKAGLIGQKIAATLASTGTPSHYLHPAEAVHGDLGRVQPHDTVLALSKSGETPEVSRILPAIADLKAPVVAVTGSKSSTLGAAADLVIELGPIEEACPLRLAPTTSTTAMAAIGDALALLLSKIKNFRSEDFGRRHPAGSLGWQLSKVDQHMRAIAECRVATDDQTVRRVFTSLSTPGRRSGAILLVDGKGKLTGLFTDSDLARLFEHGTSAPFDRPIRERMTRNPLTVVAGSPTRDAVELMSARQISELPVIDAAGRPAGLLDITDLIAVTSGKETASTGPSPRAAKKAA